MYKIVKCLILIPSDKKRENRQKVLRATWLKEAKGLAQPFFLLPSQFPSNVATPDILYTHPDRFNGERVTKDFICSLSYIKEVQSEWVLFCTDLTYIWLQRLIPILDASAADVITYKGEKGTFHFIRSFFISSLKDDEDVLEAIKGKNVTTEELTQVSSPLKYPKYNNNLSVVMGERADKILRLHFRRDTPHVAIVTIALGQYDRFFAGWYEAIQYYFLSDCTRHYYVFTDNPNLTYLDCEYCTVIPQENLGWPGNTRDRFDMFLRIKEEVETNFDYIYFLQVTARLTDFINMGECLPKDKEDWMWVTRNVDLGGLLTYDPNPRSTAYIPKGMGKIYVQGGAFGGRSKEFFQMSEACALSIRHNRENGIAEFLNDESHLNHYFLTKAPKEGWLRFCQPPDDDQKKKCKIYTLDKSRFGGFMALKQIKNEEE